MYDVVIIGAGVTGCACAMEVSFLDTNVLVIEKESDVCCQTSKANSGIVHAGYDAEPGSMKAKMNREGADMMQELCKRLDIPYIQNGSLVISNREDGKEELKRLLRQGEKNGVKQLRLLNKEEIAKMEPNISKDALYGLYAPTAAIVCPFELTIGMGEVAKMNGVEFQFDTKVEAIMRKQQGYDIVTNCGNIQTRAIINAAGVYADEIHNMVSSEKYEITARKGEYYLLDKEVGAHVAHTIFSLPTKAGKGVLVAPTTHGNLLVGPNAVDVADKEGTNTTGVGLKEVLEKSGRHVADIPMRQVITSFAGLRAHERGGDFILGEAKDAKGFFDCVGIESPGLTSAPAIGKYMAALLQTHLGAKTKANAIRERKAVTRMATLDWAEREKKIRENPAYGNIICRCEEISEGEIMEAIHRPLGARTVDGIKRRTRAGMGRCQAGFCLPKTLEILARETGQSMEELYKNGPASTYIKGKT
ncbi:MAG: NAD(P)/FAD-dependent oxidoreductase [Lachnospiraceae bacterium]|jgi:glycerol-3-phosphate dehydrogenase|nr:NAD(P)/FAD-dependent oxidoreductase [Lachnospiraceae bacterium]